MSEEQPPRFEALMEELEGLVGGLERGELALDEALARYERGVGLVRQGNGLLEAAEQKIERLQKSLGEAR